MKWHFVQFSMARSHHFESRSAPTSATLLHPHFEKLSYTPASSYSVTVPWVASYANVTARNSHMIALHCITKECKVLFTMLWVTEQQCNAMPPLTFRSREVIGLCFTFCNGPGKILNQWKWFLYDRKEETALFPTVFGRTWKGIP